MSKKVQFSLLVLILAVVSGGGAVGLLLAPTAWQEIAVVRLSNPTVLSPSQVGGQKPDNTAAVFNEDGTRLVVLSKTQGALFLLSTNPRPQVIWGHYLALQDQGMYTAHLDSGQDSLWVGVQDEKGVRSVLSFALSSGAATTLERFNNRENEWPVEDVICLSLADKEQKLSEGYRRFVGNIERKSISSTFSYSPSGAEYAFGHSDGSVVVAEQGASKASAILDTRGARIQTTCYSGNGKFLAGVGESDVFIWERRRHYGLRGLLELPQLYVASLGTILLLAVLTKNAMRRRPSRPSAR